MERRMVSEMGRDLVKCVNCGRSLLRDDAFTRVSIGTVVGFSHTELLCVDCRWPEDATTAHETNRAGWSNTSVLSLADTEDDDDDDGTY